MDYKTINHKFSCNSCNECCFNINNPTIYKDLSYNNLIKIVSNLAPHGHTSKVVLQKTEIKCDGSINIVCTTVDNWEALNTNKSIIKEILEVWCDVNSISYSSPEIQYQNIIGLIYIIDLISKYTTFKDIISSFCYDKYFI